MATSDQSFEEDIDVDVEGGEDKRPRMHHELQKTPRKTRSNMSAGSVDADFNIPPGKVGTPMKNIQRKKRDRAPPQKEIVGKLQTVFGTILAPAEHFSGSSGQAVSR
jgi:hypothetical protein